MPYKKTLLFCAFLMVLSIIAAWYVSAPIDDQSDIERGGAHKPTEHVNEEAKVAEQINQSVTKAKIKPLVSIRNDHGEPHYEQEVVDELVSRYVTSEMVDDINAQLSMASDNLKVVEGPEGLYIDLGGSSNVLIAVKDDEGNLVMKEFSVPIPVEGEQ